MGKATVIPFGPQHPVLPEREGRALRSPWASPA